MKSFQFTEYGGPLEPVERELDAPVGPEVHIAVEACGVCHSDIHLWQGYFELGGDKKLDVRAVRGLPFTLGHEIAGVVTAVGPNATGTRVGERVVVYPWIGCGSCAVCGSGDEHLCGSPRALGTHVDGGFSDQVVVPHPRYLFPYGDVPTTLACTYACSGVTAYSAVAKVRPLRPPHLVIIGAGGVGFSAFHIAAAVTDAELVVVDIDPVKLERASAAGAAHVVDASDPAALKALRTITGGGSLAVIDCVGSQDTATLGLKALAKSGILVVVGLFGGSLQIPLPFMPLKNLTVRGSDLGSMAEMGELMALARDGRIDPIPIEERPMQQAQQAMADLHAGKVLGRIVLTNP